MAATLLIGLDGATFTVLDPLVERGVMPFLGALDRARARAPRCASIMPPLTPPAWTSLMTGKRPGEHGVFDFFQKEEPDSESLPLRELAGRPQRHDLVARERRRASASSRSTSR